jgi:hypothetical protein
MKPINVIVVAGGSCMLAGAAAGLGALVLHARALKLVAGVALTMGVAIAFLPLTAAGLHALYLWVRGRLERRE